MDEEHIGEWATRIGPGDQSMTYSHHVESRIDSRFVMTCGRQMQLQTNDGELQFTDEPIDRRCSYCQR